MHPVKSVIFVLIGVGRVILRWLLFLPPHPPCNLRSSVPLPTLLVTPASLPVFNEIKIERIRNSDSSLNTFTPANELPLILHHVRTPHEWWAQGRAAKRVSRHDQGIAPTIMVARVALATDSAVPTNVHISGLQFQGHSGIDSNINGGMDNTLVIGHSP